MNAGARQAKACEVICLSERTKVLAQGRVCEHSTEPGLQQASAEAQDLRQKLNFDMQDAFAVAQALAEGVDDSLKVDTNVGYIICAQGIGSLALVGVLNHDNAVSGKCKPLFFGTRPRRGK